MKKIFLCLTALWAFSTFSAVAFAKDGDGLRYLPVQDGGRIKPYDTFAREMLQLVYGKQTYQERQAYEIIFTWMLSPQDWQDRDLFEVRNKEVLQQLKLIPEKRWYTGKELFNNESFTLMRAELHNKLESKEKLTPYLQALQRLENQFIVFQELAAGRLLRVAPPKEGTTWVSVADLEDPLKGQFLEMTKAFIGQLGASANNSGSSETGKALDVEVQKFKDLARAQNPALYEGSSKVDVEVAYNQFHPFKWAYLCYLLSAVIMLLMWISRRDSLVRGAWVFTLLGFCLHVYGFSVRIYLAGRPPVSNMYETVVWVAFGAVLFSMILEYIYKYRFILFAGTLVGLFSLVIADSAPAVLDPSLQPLEAVLRSNYWLIIHVMPITISYAAFFLAFVLGDIGLVYYIKGEEKYKTQIKAIVMAIYRAIQIGVVFIAPGIILGGLWADVSWGRFWGWDPKETWALIVLLGYMALLHGRMTTWIRDFGMVASAVLGFNLVIMAWYGVNFILGAGLHSYGWSAGGVEYVAVFVGAHLLWVVYVSILRKGRLSNS
jgi:cytochrome c-type biogenesis protein CcsB